MGTSVVFGHYNKFGVVFIVGHALHHIVHFVDRIRASDSGADRVDDTVRLNIIVVDVIAVVFLKMSATDD